MSGKLYGNGSMTRNCPTMWWVCNSRIAWKKNEVADGEATTFSIFYINTLFLLLVLGSFFFLRSFHPLMYPYNLTSVQVFVLITFQ